MGTKTFSPSSGLGSISGAGGADLAGLSESAAAQVKQTFLSGIQVRATTGLTQPRSNAAPTKDMRIRLSALNPSDVYFSGIMTPLVKTGGMLFPYTPQISFTQSVNYMDLQLVHSNTDYPAYTRTPSVTISINGKFTVQNQFEGQYALACLHFLRTASKCFFGEHETQAGLPPPILVLDGYGNYMFNQLRVILKSHNWSFDDSTDGVNINIDSTVASTSTVIATAEENFGSAPQLASVSGTARLPALFTVSCELMVVQTPQRMREQFSFKKFASGELMQGKNVGWI